MNIYLKYKCYLLHLNVICNASIYNLYYKWNVE